MDGRLGVTLHCTNYSDLPVYTLHELHELLHRISLPNRMSDRQ